MSRWEPNARDRLERAAVELFIDQGFAETTVPQITARAGLTTRTFFRHFADKRAVLFARDEELPALVARLAADAPASLSPMRVIAHALETVSLGRAEVRSPMPIRERRRRRLTGTTRPQQESA
jgi:AcrR family transcriptional regulator